ncbi:hypothetical protein Fcan01_05447 [Folsomia candida]|uniref:Uncharacterized protein n=1 Tax=Folsomia candida TaxID=158441 RepID=A0A226EQM6_FOLCA|nr:hypothetical protein Fcan01_05447 [Folsomia candida]
MGVRHWVSSTVSVSATDTECRWTQCQCRSLWSGVGGQSVSATDFVRVSVDKVSVSRSNAHLCILYDPGGRGLVSQILGKPHPLGGWLAFRLKSLAHSQRPAPTGDARQMGVLGHFLGFIVSKPGPINLNGLRRLEVRILGNQFSLKPKWTVSLFQCYEAVNYGDLASSD